MILSFKLSYACDDGRELTGYEMLLGHLGDENPEPRSEPHPYSPFTALPCGYAQSSEEKASYNYPQFETNKDVPVYTLSFIKTNFPCEYCTSSFFYIGNLSPLKIMELLVTRASDLGAHFNALVPRGRRSFGSHTTFERGASIEFEALPEEPTSTDGTTLPPRRLLRRGDCHISFSLNLSKVAPPKKKTFFIKVRRLSHNCEQWEHYAPILLDQLKESLAQASSSAANSAK